MKKETRGNERWSLTEDSQRKLKETRLERSEAGKRVSEEDKDSKETI